MGTLEDKPTLAGYVADAIETVKDETEPSMWESWLADDREDLVFTIANLACDDACSNGSSDYSGTLNREFRRAQAMVRTSLTNEAKTKEV